MSDLLKQSTLCNPDHYLVGARVKGRVSVNSLAKHRHDVERFNMKKLNDVTLKNSIILKS
jgi:hypothetical protein